MSLHMEFQGKTLDDAIQQACEFYGVSREKLEIEIISDAKTGIFGLVGVKKACIRASRVQMKELLTNQKNEEHTSTEEANAENNQKDTLSTSAETKKESLDSIIESFAESSPKNSKKVSSPKDTQGKKLKKHDPIEKKEPNKLLFEDTVEPASHEHTVKKEPFLKKSQKQYKNNLATAKLTNESLADFVITDENWESIQCTVAEVVKKLVFPIAGEIPIEISRDENRVNVSLTCIEAPGLLVGKEGQTLSSIQYLAIRIIAKKLNGTVRLQIDVGDYKERQDKRLFDLALSLAEKAKSTGKSQSTRPLSAYQRRIIHMTLEKDIEIQTISKGDGAQRRVIIQRKNKFKNQVAPTPSEAEKEQTLDTASLV